MREDNVEKEFLEPGTCPWWRCCCCCCCCCKRRCCCKRGLGLLVEGAVELLVKECEDEGDTENEDGERR